MNLHGLLLFTVWLFALEMSGKCSFHHAVEGYHAVYAMFLFLLCFLFLHLSCLQTVVKNAVIANSARTISIQKFKTASSVSVGLNSSNCCEECSDYTITAFCKQLKDNQHSKTENSRFCLIVYSSGQMDNAILCTPSGPRLCDTLPLKVNPC